MLKEKKLINDLDSVQPLFVSYALTNTAWLDLMDWIRHGYGVWYEQKQISTVQAHKYDVFRTVGHTISWVIQTI